MPPLLFLSAVSKRFESGTQALAEFDLDVAEGEFLTLVGPSGCGKSTVLRLIAGLLAPDSGTVMFPSDKPETADAYGVQMVEDIVALLDHLQVKKAHIVGYSMGGMVAASLAIAHPEQVKMLVLCDAAGINPVAGPLRMALNQASPGMAERMWLDERGIKKNSGKAFAHPENFPQERINDDIALIRQPDAKQYAYAILTSLQDTAGQNLRPQLDKIICPTLIIWGEKDAILSPNFASFWNQDIKGSHLYMVPDAGHIPMVETPVLFNKAVEIFIHGFWDDRMFNNRR